ncbi:MAG TPA: T9SS type A sorting domain-containing protein, partial [Candidatus Krumholzibacteria bacterium]|nr:T9SS type A sorting domain-containing protein [Candidatus Krumholzibacteria bacterium]
LRNGNYDIYAQRVNGAGVPQWASGGVAICTDGGTQRFPRIVSDAAGGAIIAWSDNRYFTSDFFAQRINGSGVGQWGVNGVPMFVDFYLQDFLAMAPDQDGGAILAWIDYQFADQRIMAQQVTSAGALYYPVGVGLVVCSAPGDKGEIVIARDGAYGATVAWTDTRGGTDLHLYAQRITGSGALWWQPDGIPISTVSGTEDLAIAFDGAGGAVVSWSDYRNGFDADVYAQRFNEQGLTYWPANGALVCSAPSHQWETSVIPDGAGGAIVSWLDLRAMPFYADIYANRVNSSGAVTWAFNGIPLCTAIANQRRPIVVTDGDGGAIVAWEDFRSGNSDLHAQRVEKRGYWGRPEPFAESASDVPGDQGGKVAVNWTASGQDIYDQQIVTHYSVWRATDVEPAAAAIVSSAEEIEPDFQGTAYRRELDAAGDEYYWEWVGNQSAIYSPRYSFSASTRSDSTSQGNADHFFQVLAHTWNNFVHWTSNVVSGHSLDNLAPAAPLLLTAQRVGRDVHLRWNRSIAPDVRDYSIYRATTTGVTPVPANFMASATDTVLVDESTPVSALYYIVTAYDVHENQSDASNEANVGALTGSGETPSVRALTVLQNYPNPFTGSTELEIGLPASADVSIQVYDVAGRVVREERLAGRPAGWQRIALDGRGRDGKPLASGVYFYRVTAAGQTVTKKMVIAR